MSIQNLFTAPLRVVNVGIEAFKDTCEQFSPPASQVDWRPPVEVAPGSEALLAKHAAKIERANQKVMEILLAGTPKLVGLDIALNVIPGMTKDTILHAGPPITWDRMCGPLKGAIIGALLYERRATTVAAARKLASSGRIKYAPCHEHATTGPMAGVVSPSMPVFIVKNTTHRNKAYATMNEGLGKVLRYGAYGPDVIKRLRWMEEELYPVLKAATARWKYCVDRANNQGPIKMRWPICRAITGLHDVSRVVV